jgi:hypothetical protein
MAMVEIRQADNLREGTTYEIYCNYVLIKKE